MRSAGSLTSRPARRPTTSTAPTGRARISSAPRSSRSTRGRASGSGTSRWCITISGTTTTPRPRVLTTIRRNGKPVDVVAQAGKTGFLYVFNRTTGEPIWPIEERPVPKSDVPGEQAWPTQPFPTNPPPFARQKLTPDDVNPYILTRQERTTGRSASTGARNAGLFTPPATRRDALDSRGAGRRELGNDRVQPDRWHGLRAFHQRAVVLQARSRTSRADRRPPDAATRPPR